jgi:membrane protease YdiL (CAAX protease family)
MKDFVTAAVRAGAIVFGISALAALAQKLVAASGMRESLIVHQLSWPGALWLAEFVSVFTYGLAVLLLASLAARPYWRELFPQRINWLALGAACVSGVLFALFVNRPAHMFLFDILYDAQPLSGGALSEALVTGVAGELGGASPLLTMAGISTIFLSPFIEELTDRGIIFRECADLAIGQAAFVSFLVFSLSHYATGGIPKVLAIAPAALLFVAVRAWTGSFLYSAAAHAAMNLSALMLPKLL